MDPARKTDMPHPTMTDEEFVDRAVELLDMEAATGTMTWWWLSFADGDLPKGQQFLGVAIVEAMGFFTATMVARAHGINPGGECQGFQFPPGRVPPDRYQNRLLTRPEAEALDNELGQ
jgi:hypothetical protein